MRWERDKKKSDINAAVSLHRSYQSTESTKKPNSYVHLTTCEAHWYPSWNVTRISPCLVGLAPETWPCKKNGWCLLLLFLCLLPFTHQDHCNLQVNLAKGFPSGTTFPTGLHAPKRGALSWTSLEVLQITAFIPNSENALHTFKTGLRTVAGFILMSLLLTHTEAHSCFAHPCQLL